MVTVGRTAVGGTVGIGHEDSDRWLGNLHPALRRCWHPVAAAGGLADGTEVELLGERWTLSGRAGVWGADTGRAGERRPAAATTTHLGLVWIAPEPPIPPLPVVPEADDPAFVAVAAPPWDWAAGAGQMADGACDITHIPFLHRATIGNPGDALVPPYSVTCDPDAWTATARYSHTARALDPGPDPAPRYLPRHVLIEHTAPFVVRLRLEHPEENVILTSVFLHQPGWRDRTRLWCINYRTDIADGRCTPEEATALHRLVNAEDRAMLERYPHKELPLDLTEEVHVRADRITVELRRSLRRLVRAGAEPCPPGTVTPSGRRPGSDAAVGGGSQRP
jgi:phenylpropionate dioxygenase-like ring-hydroxylating dioxygenase large terminal subunit